MTIPPEKSMFATSTPLRREDAGASCFDKQFSPVSFGNGNSGKNFQTPRQRKDSCLGDSLLPPLPLLVLLSPLTILRKQALLFMQNLQRHLARASHKNSFESKKIFLEEFPSILHSRCKPSIEIICVRDMYFILNACGKICSMQFSLPEVYKLYHKIRSLQSLSSPQKLHSLDSSVVNGEITYWKLPNVSVNNLDYLWKTRKSENADSYNQISMFDESEDSGLGCSSVSLTDSSLPFYEEIFSPERDIVRELNKINSYEFTSKLLSYLPTKDILTVSSVSRSWRSIVLSDKTANKRREEYLIQKRLYKENKHTANPKETTEDRVQFQDLANKQPTTPKQPLEKSTITLYNSFVKAGKNLQLKETLSKCPNCQHPSKREIGSKYCCTRQFCAYEFCRDCGGPYLDNHTCNKPNHSDNVPKVVIGSQKSKKRLRRL